MSPSRSLIPDDARALYEELVAEGGRTLRRDDPFWKDSRLLVLMEAGLAVILDRDPAAALPVEPDAAFAQILARWQRAMQDRRRMNSEAERMAARLNAIAVRRAAVHDHGAACVPVVRKHQVTSLHAALHASAEALLRAFLTGPYGEPVTSPTGDTLPVSPSYVGPSADFRAHGGRMLALADQDHLNAHADNMSRGYANGEEARIVQEKLPMKLLIVDDHTALVPLGPYGYPCLLIRDPGLVATFATFFDLKWAQGEPWAPPGTPTPIKDDTQRQRILDALAAGLKDEAIARQLGVSVRTVRRHITALMQQLGASTRFAAGVAAVRRGWVTRPA
jgi:DNA-binding CsgD family transcriptional regulator